MPILVATQGGVIVDPGTGTDPGGGGTSPGTGGGPSGPLAASTLTLTTSDGTEFDLSNWPNLTATVGRKGFDAVSYNAYTDESPMVDGEIFRTARALPRDMIVPIYLRAETRADFLMRKRELLSKLSPVRGMARITVSEEDGTRRWIGVYFTGRGAEGDASRDQAGRTWLRYNLEFRAPEPYWRGDPIRVVFTPPDATPFFPILPFKVQSGTSFGDTDFLNPGDVMSYPKWTITGPTTGVILTRTTEGLPQRKLQLDLTLTSGQYVVVDTDPQHLSILDHAGANRWPNLAAGSAFWRINPGLNRLNVTISAPGVGTKVELAAEPRYETA